MARSFDNRELAALIAKYSKQGFIPMIIPAPDDKPVASSAEDSQDIVRAISENAVKKHQPRKGK